MPRTAKGALGASSCPNHWRFHGRPGSSGKPSFEIHAGSAWDRVHWTAGLEARIANVDAIYFGTLGQRDEVSRATIRRALSLAKWRGILRVLDVNLRKPFYDPELIRESIALASVLKLSDDELPEVAAACGISVSQTAAETLQAVRERCRLALVVMTRGAEGALLVSSHGIIDQPGIPTTVVDTVGAGDSFTAAFVLGIRMLSRLRYEVAKLWRRWLQRRNRSSSPNWERFQGMLSVFPLFPARIVHSKMQ